MYFGFGWVTWVVRDVLLPLWLCKAVTAGAPKLNLIACRIPYIVAFIACFAVFRPVLTGIGLASFRMFGRFKRGKCRVLA
jgi:hypothetical protein